MYLITFALCAVALMLGTLLCGVSAMVACALVS